MSKSRKSRFIPIYVAIGIVFGILIGNFYANQYSGKSLSIINASGNKLNDLLHIIDDQYVDTVDMVDLVENALPQILKELDPHSVYISKESVEASMQDLKGSFSGVGIQFYTYKDTVCVVQVIPGGPSESAGLQAGDRIVRIDDEEYVGDAVVDAETKKRLKGETGSTVKLGIVRPGEEKELTFSIIRGAVPVKTVDAAYMLNDSTGYIRIASFGDTTYPEFLAALAKLNRFDFQNMVLDLRGNLGGYMVPAVQVANEFLPKNRLIVYTEGRKSSREEYASDGRGAYQSMPLVVLVDETSASASEILSGAMQDNDRAMIVGRRTFGKGLVQVPIEFNDGSMLRLTKARYYTPSGRCVQKPYTSGADMNYEMDLLKRLEHGEFDSKDSIHSSGKEYRTRIGRPVYGGGGIIPDIFIPRDTLGMTSYFKDAYLAGLFGKFAFDFVDTHRKDIREFKKLEELEKYFKKYHLVDMFVRFAQKNGLKRRNILISKSRKLLDSYIKSAIISDVLDIESTVEFINSTDPYLENAVKLFEEGRAFPALPNDSLEVPVKENVKS